MRGPSRTNVSVTGSAGHPQVPPGTQMAAVGCLRTRPRMPFDSALSHSVSPHKATSVNDRASPCDLRADHEVSRPLLIEGFRHPSSSILQRRFHSLQRPQRMDIDVL
jgi:hypothetical protein